MFSDKYFGEQGCIYRAWNSYLAGVPLWLLAAAFTIYWLFCVPSPGKAIGVLAVVAGVMSIREMKILGKIAWLVLLVCLLVTEFRAIDKDREDNAKDLAAYFTGLSTQADKNLKDVLAVNNLNLKQILDDEHAQFGKALEDQDESFAKTLLKITDSHKEDEKEFAGVFDQQRQLFKQQRELSEQFAGRLVAGDKPVPENACTKYGEQPSATQMLAVTGTNASILEGNRSIGLVSYNEEPVLSLDRIEGTTDLALRVEMRATDGTILFRIDKNGLVNPYGAFLVLHPNKSTLLLQDRYGKEFMRATFINEHAVSISGRVVYCGRAVNIENEASGGCTTNVGRGAQGVMDTKLPYSCPKQQPKQ